MSSHSHRILYFVNTHTAISTNFSNKWCNNLNLNDLKTDYIYMHVLCVCVCMCVCEHNISPIWAAIDKYIDL